MLTGVFTPPPAVQWPLKAPDSYLDFAYDGTADVGADTLTSVSLAIKPSGAGELAASSLTATTTGLVTVWLGGGIAGRSYVIKILGVCNTGRQYEWVIGITIDPALAVYPLPDPPSFGFGTPITHP